MSWSAQWPPPAPSAAPAAPPPPPAPGAAPDGAAVNKRLNGLSAAIKAAMAGPNKAGVQTRFVSVSARIKNHDFVGASKVLDELEALLQGPRTAGGGEAPESDGKLSLVKLGKARLEWINIRQKAVQEIDRLMSILQKRYQGDPKQKGALTSSEKRLKSTFAAINEELGSKLDDVLNAAPEKRAPLIAAAKGTLGKFIHFIATDEIMSVIDGNEYAPDMAIAGPMRASKLAEIKAASWTEPTPLVFARTSLFFDDSEAHMGLLATVLNFTENEDDNTLFDAENKLTTKLKTLSDQLVIASSRASANFDGQNYAIEYQQLKLKHASVGKRRAIVTARRDVLKQANDKPYFEEKRQEYIGIIDKAAAESAEIGGADVLVTREKMEELAQARRWTDALKSLNEAHRKSELVMKRKPFLTEKVKNEPKIKAAIKITANNDATGATFGSEVETEWEAILEQAAQGDFAGAAAKTKAAQVKG